MTSYGLWRPATVSCAPHWAQRLQSTKLSKAVSERQYSIVHTCVFFDHRETHCQHATLHDPRADNRRGLIPLWLREDSSVTDTPVARHTADRRRSRDLFAYRILGF